jgi:hypothetical protein
MKPALYFPPYEPADDLSTTHRIPEIDEEESVIGFVLME